MSKRAASRADRVISCGCIWKGGVQDSGGGVEGQHGRSLLLLPGFLPRGQSGQCRRARALLGASIRIMRPLARRPCRALPPFCEASDASLPWVAPVLRSLGASLSRAERGPCVAWRRACGCRDGTMALHVSPLRVVRHPSSARTTGTVERVGHHRPGRRRGSSSVTAPAVGLDERRRPAGRRGPSGGRRGSSSRAAGTFRADDGGCRARRRPWSTRTMGAVAPDDRARHAGRMAPSSRTAIAVTLDGCARRAGRYPWSAWTVWLVERDGTGGRAGR